MVMMPLPGVRDRSASSCSECSDCSLCANKTQRQMKAGVRVSVNLKHFFSDQRARAYMWAPYGRCVRWLGRRVARVFGLPDDVALMSRGHMLPVNEPLLMLNQDDPIEVVNMPFVFAIRESQHAASQRTIGETLPTSTRENPRASFNVKHENIGQLPTSSQESCSINHNITELHQRADSEATVSDCIAEQSADDKQELARLKRRALELLQEHCTLSAGSASKRVRRRVRRRKRTLATPPSPPAPLSPPAHPSLPSPPAPPAAPTPPAPSSPGDAVAAPADEDDDGVVTVLRNGPGSRPPRLVRPLPPISQFVM